MLVELVDTQAPREIRHVRREQVGTGLEDDHVVPAVGQATGEGPAPGPEPTTITS